MNAKVFFRLTAAALLLAGCGPTDNAVAIAQAQAAIEANRTAQAAAAGLATVATVNALTIFLPVVTLCALAALAAYVVIIEPRRRRAELAALLAEQREQNERRSIGRRQPAGQMSAGSRITTDDLIRLLLVQNIKTPAARPENSEVERWHE